MPYFYLDDVATADVAFMAKGNTLEELFISAADATINVMINDLKSIDFKTTVSMELTAENYEMLLFEFLEELVFYKDAKHVLLRGKSVTFIQPCPDEVSLKAVLKGEKIILKKHVFDTDIKAITLHQFRVTQKKDGTWEAIVVLDV